MSTHDCEGRLSECYQHPRWNVVRYLRWWCVFQPMSAQVVKDFQTHAAAIAYATSLARAEKVAAIQDGAA